MNAYQICERYLNQRRYPVVAGPRGEGNAAFVTISRQAGAGARAICELLIGYLGEHDRAGGPPWALFDKTLLKQIMEEHHLPERFAEFMSEDKVSEVREHIAEAVKLHPSNQYLVRKTCETLGHLAQLGNVILVGRAANIVTGRLSGGLHVHLVGSSEQRVARVMARVGLSREDADALVRTEDEGRRRYVKSYFDRDVDDPLLYDLIVNTDSVSYAEAARLIGRAVLDRRERLDAAPPPAASRMVSCGHWFG